MTHIVFNISLLANKIAQVQTHKCERFCQLHANREKLNGPISTNERTNESEGETEDLASAASSVSQPVAYKGTSTGTSNSSLRCLEVFVRDPSNAMISASSGVFGVRI